MPTRVAPKFSVVIPFHRGDRGHASLLECVRSCQEQSIKGGVEICVITNLPDPALCRALQGQPRVALECVGALGVNRARNLGARKARGEWVLFLDDDCRLPDRDFLASLERIFRENPRFSALGGGYLSLPQTGWRGRGYNAMANAWVRLGLSEMNCPVAAAENLLGGNACYRRELFIAGNFFDPGLISGGDETEFNGRLRAKGLLLGYSARLSVLHFAADGWGALFARARRQGLARGQARAARFPRARGAFRTFLPMLKQELGALPFSLIHFPVVYFFSASAKRAPRSL